MKRNDNLEKIKNEIFDIAIIGGGVTGAGILQEASKKGYRAILIEKNDFAGGTSSKSAKLIHGGLRYLQYGQIGLVMESLTERDYLLSNFPHIVKPIPLMFPSYKSKFVIEVGMLLYQFFSKSEKIPKYKSLNKEQTVKEFAAIEQDKLEGSFIYYDALTNDARLANEVIYLAEDSGNAFAFNHLEFKSYEQTAQSLNIECYDHVEKKAVTIKSQYIINAAGPWVDKVLNSIEKQDKQFVEPGKGIHIVLSQDKFPTINGVLFESYANDERMLYAVPWENNSVIIGATDTLYKDDYDNVPISDDDVDYLVNAVQKFAPSLNVTRKDILSTFVGLRPLFKEENKSTKDMSRDFKIWWTNDRVQSIVGGKLTTFRSMAKTCLKKFKKKTKYIPTSVSAFAKRNLIDTQSINTELIKSVEKRYDSSASVIFQLCLEREDYQQIVHKDFPVYIAELIYFMRHQHVYYIDDMLTRRFSLRYVLAGIKSYKEIVDKVISIMKKELQWSDIEAEQEKTQFILMIEDRLNIKN